MNRKNGRRSILGVILVFVIVATAIIGVFATDIINIDDIPSLDIGSSSAINFDNAPVQSGYSSSAKVNKRIFKTEENENDYFDILKLLHGNQELDGLKEALSDIIELEKLEPDNSRVLGLKNSLEWRIKIKEAKKNGVYNTKFKTEENENDYFDILKLLHDNQDTETYEEALYYIIHLEKLESDNFRVLGLKRSLEMRLKHRGVDVEKLKECFKLIDADNILFFDNESTPYFDIDDIPVYDLDSIPVYDLDSIPVYDLDSIPVYDLDNIPVYDLDRIPEFNTDNIPNFNPR